ncbi:MAG: DoxX family membrane protein [bacterium]|nr:DoxX family membrane protein [bacterium]
MFTSARYSFWFLKIGLAAVFIWFGIDKFIHPSYWINAWVPAGFLTFLARFNIDGQQFIFLMAIFEMLVGISLLTGILVKTFSFLSILFLVSVFFTAPLNEVIIRDIGLIGGFLAILFWPNRRHSL